MPFQVSFLNQEALIEAIQKAVEHKLLESNTSRTFHTQVTRTSLPLQAGLEAGRWALLHDSLLTKDGFDCCRLEQAVFVSKEDRHGKVVT